MSQATLAIRQISGHAGVAPGDNVERDYQVCKLIDTTTSAQDVSTWHQCAAPPPDPDLDPDEPISTVNVPANASRTPSTGL